MKKAKIGVFAIVFVIASAGMGISYASVNGIPRSIESDGPSGLIGIRAVDWGDKGFDQVRVEGNTYQGEKDIAVTEFYNNGDASLQMYIGGELVDFYNESDPSPSLVIDNNYPCYASSITFWFGNTGNSVADINSVILEEATGLNITDWDIGDGAITGFGKNDLIDALVNSVTLPPTEYLSVKIDFYFQNNLPEDTTEYFNYKFVWWS